MLIHVELTKGRFQSGSFGPETLFAPWQTPEWRQKKVVTGFAPWWHAQGLQDSPCLAQSCDNDEQFTSALGDLRIPQYYLLQFTLNWTKKTAAVRRLLDKDGSLKCFILTKNSFFVKAKVCKFEKWLSFFKTTISITAPVANNLSFQIIQQKLTILLHLGSD